MNHDLKIDDVAVNKIFSIFEDLDFQIRLVGGCVRDLILGKEIFDYDFTTDALPNEIMHVLDKNLIKYIPTGIKHGTITAVIDGNNFEITTLRKDIETFGRQAKVEFTDDFAMDAARRDLTINAMSMDKSANIFDYFGGLDDLKVKKLKFVGDPELRIKEDYLRILRLFRFSAVLDSVNFDSATFNSAVKSIDLITNLSAERRFAELQKLLLANGLIKLLEYLQGTNFAEIVFFHKDFDVKNFMNLLILEKKFLQRLDIKLRLAFVFRDNVQKFSNFYKPPKRQISFLQKINDYLQADVDIEKICHFEEKDFCKYICLLKSNTQEQKKIEWQIIENYKKQKFPLTGEDLKSRNLQAGPEYKMILSELENDWLDKKRKPNRNEILQKLDLILKKYKK